MARNPKVVQLPVTFEAHLDHVVAIMAIGDSTIGIRFTSPEMIAEFCMQLMEKAKTVWPDNPLIQEYVSDD